MNQPTESYNSATQKIIKYVNCPYQVFTCKNTAGDLMYSYWEAVKRGKEQGFTPLLVVSGDTLAETLEFSVEDSYSKEKVISQPKKDIEKMLREQYQEAAEAFPELGAKEVQQTWYDETGEELEEFGEEVAEFSSCYAYGDGGIVETILFEIPVKNPWEVIAWVPMGGWNECPAADDMMEVCRHWYINYGAIPALISSDTLEFMLEKPVSDLDTARKLAREHFAFCNDRVYQGTETGTIDELAYCISKSTVWFFWWD